MIALFLFFRVHVGFMCAFHVELWSHEQVKPIMVMQTHIYFSDKDNGISLCFLVCQEIRINRH